MKPFLFTLTLSVLLVACGSSAPEYPADATQSEINMATQMGISVEELRNQTPEEHMRMMREMMNDDEPTDNQGASDIQKVYDTLSPQAKALYHKQSKGLTQPVPPRLVELDEKNIGCFGPKQVMSMNAEDTNLGGQCCGALTSYDGYKVQLEAIEHFIVKNGGEGLVPPDPYDLSVEVAQELTRYDTDISLNEDQQATFDEAVAMSHHGGPCCCKCWKWYVMSGLAKKLIVDESWNANQIAELWDISSSCGHSEDTNFHQHYS